ncbi:MAG: alkyl hydroperoxide reductase [Labilithrix sp.]|nr:alkyl hydroperoxide reductase [Labilithrix sp.]
MLKPGDLAPEIDALASDGKRFRLSAQSTRLCTVVYFFPKAFTPGCTAETKRFRDNFVELSLAGASIVGISTDDHASQCSFAESLRAPFPMIGDADRAISTAYGVLWPVIERPKRVTFIVSPVRIIEAVFHHEVQISRHRDDVLRQVDQLFRARRPSDAPPPRGR